MLHFAHLVMIVQFASTTFTGLESSGEIIVSIVITGRIPNTTVPIVVGFTSLTAAG